MEGLFNERDLRIGVLDEDHRGRILYREVRRLSHVEAR